MCLALLQNVWLYENALVIRNIASDQNKARGARSRLTRGGSAVGTPPQGEARRPFVSGAASGWPLARTLSPGSKAGEAVSVTAPSPEMGCFREVCGKKVSPEQVHTVRVMVGSE